MKPFLLFAMLIAWFATFAFPQTNPRLAILPFTGGTAAEGRNMAAIFSAQRNITGAFTVIPTNSALLSTFEAYSSRLSGLTDADAVADIGQTLGADYVLSGSTRRLGETNLVIATIIRVATFEQVAGFYYPYRSFDEARDFVPSMATRMISTAFRDTSRLSAIAIMPLNAEGISAYDAETLATILAIEIHNTGSYTVIPRTSAIAEFQVGESLGENLPSLGETFNVQLALYTETSGIENLGRISSRILNVNNGRVLSMNSVNYRTIPEGVDLMGELAILLTTRPGAARNLQIAEHRSDPRRISARNDEAGAQEIETQRPEAETAKQPGKLRSPILANARRNVLDINFAYYFDGVHEDYNDAYVLGLGVYLSPIPFLSLGLEGKLGWHWINGPSSGEPAEFDMFIASPVIGLVIPLGRSTRIFANGIYEMGTFGPWEGLVLGWGAPGFDTGIEFTGKRNGNFNLRYRGIWLQNTYAQAAGIGFGLRF